MLDLKLLVAHIPAFFNGPFIKHIANATYKVQENQTNTILTILLRNRKRIAKHHNLEEQKRKEKCDGNRLVVWNNTYVQKSITSMKNKQKLHDRTCKSELETKTESNHLTLKMQKIIKSK